MPDDKPDFTAAQTKHAQDIRTRRTLSRITGLTPNQVRIGLRQQDVATPTGGNPNAPEGTIPVSRNPPPLPGQVMQFDPRPFSPFGANDPQKAAPVMPDVVGTASNPYIMGTNSTTSGNLVLSQDDTWDITTGPSPAGAGGFDGLIIPNPVRFVLDPSTTVTKTVDQTGGGTVTISTTIQIAYERRIEANSLGAIIHISAEDGGTQTSLTFLT